MKNLILKASFLFVLILVGCSKDEIHDPVGEDLTTAHYVLDQEGDTYNWIMISSTTDGKEGVLPKPAIDRMACRGMYLSRGHLITDLSWNAFCDETGMMGSAEIKQETADYGFHFIMEPTGMIADGNNAIFEGTIVEVISRWGHVPNFDVNWRFCFNVIDMAEGVVRDFDEISNTMMFGSPRSALLCSLYPPGHSIWARDGYDRVKPPGFVEVSHNPEIPVVW